MKYSKKWLERFIPGLKKVSVEELSERLTNSLAEVEGYEYLADRWAGLVVGQVREVKRHPKSDKLYVTKVDIGTKIVQVVTGASNLKVGDFVPYTPVGGKVPVNPYSDEPLIIQAKPLAGIMSEGMLNSERELGISQEHSKILVLNEVEKEPSRYGEKRLRAGMPLAQALGYDDYLIEIENKALTHRGDVFGVLGMAREISAILELDVKFPSNWYSDSVFQVPSSRQAGVNLKIDVQAKDYVLRYAVLYVEGVQNAESPLWLKLILSKYGVAPRGYIVDLTNYLMLLLGQPIHAFDVDKLVATAEDIRQDSLHFGVRWSQKGDRLAALNNKEYVFDDKEALLITFHDRPVAIAGIIGGKDTAVDTNTKRVAFEMATFDNIAVRKGMMRLGLFTDAGVFFSRKQDPTKVGFTMSFIDDMIDYRAAAVVDLYLHKVDKYTVEFDLGWVNDFIGTDIDIRDIERIERLGIEFTQANSEQVQVVPPVNKRSTNGNLNRFIVKVPTWRFDLRLPQDIAEEIIRLKGYDKLKVKLPKLSVVSARPRQTELQVSELARSFLVDNGFTEVINYSFVSSDDLQVLGISTDTYYHIKNAVSEDVEYLREFLGVSLLKNLRYNWQFWDSVNIFEIDKVFSKLFGVTQNNVPIERTNSGLLSAIKDTDKEVRAYHFYEVKRLIKNLLAKLLRQPRLSNVRFVRLDKLKSQKMLQGGSSWLNAYSVLFRDTQAAGIFIDEILIGILGQIRTQIKADLGIGVDSSVILGELNLDRLATYRADYYKRGDVLVYPPVVQDLCFVLNDKMEVGDIRRALIGAVPKVVDTYGEPIILDMYVVDIYRAKEESNVTFRVLFVSKNSTLKEDQLTKVRKILIDEVYQQTGAKLKGAA